MHINNLSVRMKLVGSFGMLAFAVVALAGMSLRALSHSTDSFSAYVHGIDARADVASDVRTAVDRRAIAARNLVLVTTPEDLAVEKADVTKAHEDVQFSLKQLNGMIGSGDARAQGQELVADINRIEALYGPVATDIVALALADHRAEAIKKMNEQCRPLLAQLVKATSAYADFTKQRREEMVLEYAQDYASQRDLQIGLCLFAVLLAASAGIFVTRSIINPIKMAVRVAQTVARGDLRSEIVVVTRDETGELLDALRQMNERLTETVEHVRETSTNIASSAMEIAGGNTDLSQRTEQQAASLQETAASMEELTSTVKQNTENAHQASALAANASTVAHKGSEVVGQVVKTMKAISAGSEKIAEITAIIEGIAFQTNILALNAAVEAARAGEQGKGFAVVASEVRSLAQRSSNAAKEIKDLIASSARSVDDGAVLANRAGETMAEVTHAVARVTVLMQEIAAASGEQSKGIEQVNQAIAQMDEVTQQNAALVEEAAAASQALETQGKQLINAVAFFELALSSGDAPSAQRTIRSDDAVRKAQPPRRGIPVGRLPLIRNAEATVVDEWKAF